MRADFDFTTELADLVSFMSRVAIAIRMHTPDSGKTRYESAEGHCKHVLWLADSIHSFDSLSYAIARRNIDAIVFAADLNINRYRVYMTVGDKWVSDPMLTFKTVGDFPGERCDAWILSEGISLLERIKTKAEQASHVQTLPSEMVEIDVPHWEEIVSE